MRLRDAIGGLAAAGAYSASFRVRAISISGTKVLNERSRSASTATRSAGSASGKKRPVMYGVLDHIAPEDAVRTSRVI